MTYFSMSGVYYPTNYMFQLADSNLVNNNVSVNVYNEFGNLFTTLSGYTSIGIGAGNSGGYYYAKSSDGQWSWYFRIPNLNYKNFDGLILDPDFQTYDVYLFLVTELTGTQNVDNAFQGIYIPSIESEQACVASPSTYADGTSINLANFCGPTALKYGLYPDGYICPPCPSSSQDSNCGNLMKGGKWLLIAVIVMIIIILIFKN